MNILVCGAHGFVGQALCETLARDGHRILKGVRVAARPDEVAIDYMADTDPAAWTDRLRGIHVVINAVGILVEAAGATFDQVHRRAPIALFDAAHRAGVRGIVQLSALGAEHGDTPYFQSKRAADDHLRSLPVAHHILRPALLYGAHGASARFFRAMATLPVHLLPGGGRQLLRPMRVDELAEIVARLLRGDSDGPAVLDLVGGTEVEFRQMLAVYRESLGFAPAWRAPVPAGLVSVGATLLDRLPGSLLTRDTWRMLRAGNTADAAITTQVLGRPPAGIESFIEPADALTLRHQALAAWRPGLVRGALALIWLWTAVCSALLYPVAGSLALLEPVGLQGATALAALYLAAGLDFVLGIATLRWPGRRLWVAQLGLVLGYTAVIALAMPEFLLHPFGPILKNVAVVALLFILLTEEPKP
ncbi:SDR family oxidoreductase [Achromobacter deleyi]|uniref:SDR family oxidoreductase n=1 Tax=Achromobacter deleyi TaxID=1353891 RepID=UPI0014910570|nr:SDR family oxidoreductase [Achromobacter deleyi]QVQ26352.1 SDR family oxidoreductase [Achromobacter deleyi]UIP21918.1 SDR family oxidoreductase [Achromobacter deleyi]